MIIVPQGLKLMKFMFQGDNMSLFLIYTKFTECWVAPMAAFLQTVTQGSSCVALPSETNTPSYIDRREKEEH